ncbi:hypothetical protein BP5796_12197 [Coleophoma crateriformis]|uniref:Uncharacterized protein n=1 Tax=Coleophoma crateriformis TaxID=565419 RepID=A0A3D8Q9D1_9HELO|nr:hypothetical protein BP5796_12197 [Coleophoma crateriformis]
MDTDEPQLLKRVQARGTKILTYHELADPITNPQNSINYDRTSAEHTGWLAKTREFLSSSVLDSWDGSLFSDGGVRGSGEAADSNAGGVVHGSGDVARVK